MLNNSVVSFYDNLGLIFKGSEDSATNDIEYWSLSTTQPDAVWRRAPGRPRK